MENRTDSRHMPKHSSSGTEKRGSGRSLFVSCILILAAAALSYAARHVYGFAEWYSHHVYRFLVSVIGRISGSIPLSAAELLCAAIPVLLITDFIINRHALKKTAGHLIVLLSALFFLYSACCGVNYYRSPFVDPKDYEAAMRTISEEQEAAEDASGDTLLEEFCRLVITQLESSRQAVTSYPGRDDLAASARESMFRLSTEYPELRGFYPRPKQLTFLSRLFSSMGVSGIYSPFTIEANINGEMQGMEMPFTACHELSHLRGFMNEGEANYIGWLACIGSDDPAFRRSGWLIAWNYAGGSLRRADPDKFSEIAAMLPADAARELAENHEFWVTHETKASEAQDRINDAYLKSNGVEDGISSYGQLTTLMLMWYRDCYFPDDNA